MGDFNAKVGRREESNRAVRKFGLGVTNQRGEEIIDLAYKHNLKIANTFF